MNRKKAATTFLSMVIDGKIREAYAQFISPGFIHHNQYFKGDRESLLLAMEEADRKSPGKKFEIKMIIEDGDRVATFSHLRFKPEDPGMTVVHIFRFEGERVAELWDLGQPLSKDSPNENGAF